MSRSISLTLASRSPRRRQLLVQIGVEAKSLRVEVDESIIDGESPAAYVARLAQAKAQSGWAQIADGVVLGSDTTVVCDGQILGKPADQADCIATLMRLSGRAHQVLTGVALVNAERIEHCVVTTEVTFRDLSKAECLRYWQTGEPQDKAGSYGIQGLAAVFVSGISGSYSNVVGLPLKETAAMLNRFGIPVWQQA